MAGRAIRITDPADPRIAAFVSVKERDLAGREGRFIAEGTVVLSLLAAAHGRGDGIVAEAVLLLENRLNGVEPILERFGPEVPVYVADRAVFNAIAGFDMHRGVMAIGRRGQMPSLETVIARLPERALVLTAIGISNHDNMGALFRNAAAFGAEAVLIDETSCDPFYRKALRVSVGSVLTVPQVRGGSASDMLSALTAAGFSLFGLSPRGELALQDLKPAARTALVMGTEGEGLPPHLMAALPTLRIRQRPGLDSLNVATAAGIALHHAAALNGLI
ncbi:tRNA G18 (ribose-2'-O)-methylase SpoU [Rhizobium sp. RU20A]|uniref:TrmH family RNA methyltransferase n=1 Tax=Rhizobium sp. RU20A TaxID=1907412 RepID=UPI000957049B|nr:RNA methyltransferase [Rhizobium sp. RU20A]SIQ36977.1 tRNA G18 (ribose-2'-O)-methylase SpoU [Rhizobium sp. RU20A]